MDLLSWRWQAECVGSVHEVFGLMGCGGSKSTDTVSNGKSKEKEEDYLQEPENDPVRRISRHLLQLGSLWSYIESIAIFREEKNNLSVKKKWNNLNEDTGSFLGGCWCSNRGKIMSSEYLKNIIMVNWLMSYRLIWRT